MFDCHWYNSLNQPYFLPPAWLFGPVWAVLYFLIFLSLFLFLRHGEIKSKIFPLALFVLQIVLNFLWTPLFFGYKQIGFALVICFMLWILIPIIAIGFFKHSKLSAILLVPYFLWVSFALYLNFEFWRLNS